MTHPAGLSPHRAALQSAALEVELGQVRTGACQRVERLCSLHCPTAIVEKLSADVSVLVDMLRQNRIALGYPTLTPVIPFTWVSAVTQLQWLARGHETVISRLPDGLLDVSGELNEPYWLQDTKCKKLDGHTLADARKYLETEDRHGTNLPESLAIRLHFRSPGYRPPFVMMRVVSPKTGTVVLLYDTRTKISVEQPRAGAGIIAPALLPHYQIRRVVTAALA